MTDKELLEREELLEDILDALEDGDYEEAEDLADEAIEDFPEEAFGYYYMGEAMFLQGDVEDALEYYQQATEKASENPDYKARLALMYSKLNQEEAARQLYQLVLDINDKHTASLVALGVYAINDGEPEMALKYLDKAIEHAPDYNDAYKIRSIVHTNMSNYQYAIADVDKSLEFEPTDAELWRQRISLYDLIGDDAVTSKVFKEWVDLEPEDSSRHYAYANFFVGTGNHKFAEESFSNAIEKELYGDFNAIYSFLGRGWARLNQEKVEEALADFSRVIDLDAKIADAYLGIAEGRVKQGNIERASTYLDLGTDIVIDDRWMLFNKKGAIHAKVGNYDIAEKAFQTLIDMDDEEIEAEGHFSMGKMHQMKGDMEAAFRSWRKASDIFHIEADEHIDEFCSEFIAMELQEKEEALLGNMVEDFQENKKSKILSKFFNKFWKVDIKATKSKNKMFAQMPANMESQIMGLLENICLGIVPEGVILLNPGQDNVRMLYSVKEETAKSVVIDGIPLNGGGKRDFTLAPIGNYLALRGFGDKDADIDIFLEESSVVKLPSKAKAALQKLVKDGSIDFMGEAFKASIK